MEKSIIKSRLAEAGIDLTNKRIVIAVSGGADSMACAHFFTASHSFFGYRELALAHVNHRLRGTESDADEALVAAFAKDHRLTLHSTAINGLDYTGESLENWCRSQRYTFFDSLIIRHSFDYCITAHTLSDLCESLLMKLERGVGFGGLEAIHLVRNARYLRPLIHLSRAEIMHYVTHTATPFREDASNSDQKYKRNYVRHTTLPQFMKTDPHFAEGVLHITDAVRVLRPRIETFAASVCGHTLIKELPDMILLATHDLQAIALDPLNKDLIFIFLDALWKKHALSQLDTRLFEEIYLFLEQGSASGLPLKIELKNSWKIHANKRFFLVHRSVTYQPFVYPFTVKTPCTFTTSHEEYTITSREISANEVTHFESNGSSTVWFDADKLPSNCQIRNKSINDVFSPLGICSKTRKLITFLNDKKILTELHDSVPLLAHDTTILWVIGHQISETFKIDETTHRIIEMSITCKIKK